MPTTSDSPKLFTPISVGTTTIRNRVWLSPMCQYSCPDRDGMPNNWHFAHLTSFAAGGFGLVMTEATAVVPEGRISDRDTGIWSSAQAEAWAQVVAGIHERGATAGIQLAHAGRKASTYSPWGETASGTIPADAGGWQTVAPSPLAFGRLDAPRQLDLTEIDALVDAFADAATRSIAAGFDVVEIHAAHGYLLHQFLSPAANERTDEYGGSPENRARLLIRVIEAVRASIGDAALMVRLSGTDWSDSEVERWDADACAAVAARAEAAGADAFDLSSGGILAHPDIPLAPGYQVQFATRVREAVSVPVSAVGLIDDAACAEQIVTSERADAVMLGRSALRNPQRANEWAATLGAAASFVPGQYERAY
ncbi:NADH:flavin oxidoreductase/NADH oxidase [Paramicrobacterium agarici]|uniref:NADH:flavin oxidoreductase/NADH oxidase n=1 Tax=Paramicrobacterium agarici TaxID=630514 RepID=UPI001152FF99|nr:NADH:flavin oxidoreductase/NADH oxidase [Microbacterium agarici]TQO23945.1 2,4-dienoyl-CoA reductase-like NADH-dependent reductase (Old Yellow Enzyme family) [Microbacterium agarici]